MKTLCLMQYLLRSDTRQTSSGKGGSEWPIHGENADSSGNLAAVRQVDW